MTASWAIGTGYVGALGPLITSATVPLSVQYNCTISEFIAGTNGGLLVAIGIFAIISNATSVVVGKRPIYFLGNLLCAASCFWCAYATNLKSLTAARVIQGFGIAPFETLTGPTISDYHHVHTRGQMIALFNFGVLGGINLASPIAGVILDKAGIKTCFNAAGGFGVFLLIFCFFFMPETSFHRSSALSIDTGSTDNLHAAVEVEAREKETTLASQVSNVDESASRQNLGKRQSFWKDLRIFVISILNQTNCRATEDTIAHLLSLLDPFG
jgi:MFS family permease